MNTTGPAFALRRHDATGETLVLLQRVCHALQSGALL
jgi:hypothetical protein